MDGNSILRMIIICMGLIEILLLILWLTPRMRDRTLPTGEVLARAGGGFLVLGLTYGTAEVLFGLNQTLRLPLIMVGLAWLIIGLSFSVVNDYRDRHRDQS